LLVMSGKSGKQRWLLINKCKRIMFDLGRDKMLALFIENLQK
jgi:hypothetical protein